MKALTGQSESLVKRALDKYSSKLMNYPHVVGVGVVKRSLWSSLARR